LLKVTNTQNNKICFKQNLQGENFNIRLKHLKKTNRAELSATLRFIAYSIPTFNW